MNIPIKLLSMFTKRLKLKQWAMVDDWRKSTKDALLNGDIDRGAELILKSIAVFISYKISGNLLNRLLRKLHWLDVFYLFSSIMEKNRPTKNFPILTTKQKGKPEAWEYEGRSWYFWLNIIAEHYGWSEEQIANLDLDDAIGLYQEIVASQQAEREFYYGLSEVAYEYVPSTKKSRFRPLGKPDWMLHSIETATRKTATPKVKIPLHMMPAGNVINLDEKTLNEKQNSQTKST